MIPVALVLGLMCILVSPALAVDREVSVTVAVRNASGEALASVPLAMSIDGKAASSVGRTDGQGVLQRSVSVPEGQHSLIVVVMHPFADLPDAQSEPAVVEFRTLSSLYSRDRWVVQELGAEATTTTVNVVLKPAAKAQYSLVLPPGLSHVAAWHPGAALLWKPATTNAGELLVGGLPLNTSTTVFFSAKGTDRVVAKDITLPATYSGQPVAGGEVSWPLLGAEVPVAISITNGKAVPPALCSQYALSAVSIDGETLYSFTANPATGKVTSALTSSPETKLKPGTYYLTPGGFRSGSADLLYKAVRLGKQAELDAAGVPKLVVPASPPSPLVVEVDGPAVFASVRSVQSS